MTPRVVYIGNFEPPHSTENDLRRTMEDMGVEVHRLQEQDEQGWEVLTLTLIEGEPPDMVMWTRTAGLSAKVPSTTRRRMQIQAHLSGVPTVGVHLDRWWGLSRQEDLYEDPFFRCQYLFTADGHSPERWKALGANHHWMPPAIAPHNAYPGQATREFKSDIAFVGGWEGYGHTEWTHRGQLVQWLKRHYRDRVKFWPEKGQPRITSPDLNDLYASVKVVVGDSCLVPDPITGEPWKRYCSDRVFETIGRQACLVHPYVAGVIGHPAERELLSSHKHLMAWHLGEWDELRAVIDELLDDSAIRHSIAQQGAIHVQQHHTYKNRLEDIFKTVGVKL